MKHKAPMKEKPGMCYGEDECEEYEQIIGDENRRKEDEEFMRIKKPDDA